MYIPNWYNWGVNVIALSSLRSFWIDHPSAESALRNWHNVLRGSTIQSFSGLKLMFNSVELVNPYTVFDVGGNKYRVITRVSYLHQTVHIKYVFTHKEYDKWKP